MKITQYDSANFSPRWNKLHIQYVGGFNLEPSPIVSYNLTDHGFCWPYPWTNCNSKQWICSMLYSFYKLQNSKLN